VARIVVRRRLVVLLALVVVAVVVAGLVGAFDLPTDVGFWDGPA
jgi:hypothetical protein